MATAAPSDDPSIADEVRNDLERFYATWMGLLYPRQRGTEHSVLGKWTPDSPVGMVKYRAWGALGLLVLAVGYPLTVLGFATRFYSRKFDHLAVKIGLIGIVVLTGLIWAALAVAARAQFEPGGFAAVLAAAVVATVASAIAVVFTYRGGRFWTVTVGYPAAMTAIFLPPAVAALFSTGIAADVYPTGERLARWLLAEVAPNDIAARLKGRLDFDPQQGIASESGRVLLTLGVAHILLWFAISVPLGWLLGIVVTLADVIRPSGRSDEDDD
jgi:hypothetical protein